MNYLSVSQMAKKWNMSERGVRKYCAEDKIPGAFLTGCLLYTSQYFMRNTDRILQISNQA